MNMARPAATQARLDDVGRYRQRRYGRIVYSDWIETFVCRTMKPTIKKLVLSMVVGLAFVGSIFHTPPKTVAAPPQPLVMAVADSTVSLNPNAPLTRYTNVLGSKDSLDTWLIALGEKESGNKAHIKHLDSDGNYAYGCLQFHMGTWLSYGKSQGATVENIYNCNLQRAVARKMILDKYTNWKHWKYTVLHKGIGLPPTL